MGELTVETPQGPARVHLQAQPASDPRALLVLGHGAGGGVGARDLLAVAGAARSLGLAVALVEQPYRVAGRRSPPPAARLDEAWTAVVEHLLRDFLPGLPHVAGGRSSGARVACRTAAATGAAGVVCLAFPLLPPGAEPARSRLPELDGAGRPTLVIQGERDPYGMPPAGELRTVVQVTGDHGLKADLPAVAEAAAAWLARLLG